MRTTVFAMVGLTVAVASSAANVQAQTGTSNEQPGTAFSPAEFGFTITIPPTWSQTSRREPWRFAIPVPSSDTPARLEIFAANFRSDIESWRAIERSFAQQQGDTVVRQWEEEILSVPLLLTRLNRASGEVVLSGLLYNWASRKLRFRITAANEPSLQEAEFQFRQAILTIRTFDGQPLRPEDPTGPPPPAFDPTARPAQPPRVVTIGAGRPDRTSQRPEIQIPARTSGRDVLLLIPAGWTGQARGETLVLTHERLQGEVVVQLASTIDGAPPARALLRSSVETLALFDTVARRNERKPHTNRAGGQVAFVWREGQTAEGPLLALDALVANNPIYAQVRFRSHSGVGTAEMRALVQDLIDHMTVEQAG